jgi:RimK-like ATP-grasp domain
VLELHAIKGPTGRLVRQMLDEKGLLKGQVHGAVNYGFHEVAHGLPTLNANAGRQDKYKELVMLDEKGVRTIPFSRSAADLKAPIFGRKLHHTQGLDIFVYNVRPLLKGDKLSDYYTQIVPKQNEFRTWVFRDKLLATYEKKLEYANKYGRNGRNKEVWNWKNGFAYTFVQPEEVSAKLRNISIAAVEALDLDFGAVDVILGTDRWFYVLEVNTAPGVEGRRQGITSLVNCIERWAKNGFKER